MVKIGNNHSNNFWERHYQGQSLPADVEDEIRENFLTAKYVNRSWVPQGNVENKEALGVMLCQNVATDNLMRTIELIAIGANVSGGVCGQSEGGGVRCVRVICKVNCGIKPDVGR